MRCVFTFFMMTAAFAIALLSSDAASAQSASANLTGDPALRQQPLTLGAASYFYTQPPEAKEYRVRDLVEVIVKKRTLALSEGEIDRKKKGSGKYALTDWVRFNGLSLVPDPQSAGDPAISGEFDTKYKAEADLETLTAVEFTIKCEIVDIRPNGLLLIEGNDFSQMNGETWSVKFSGIIDADDILADGTILSEDVHNMWIEKNETGEVRDGYRRGWMQKFIDNVQPF